MDVVFHTGKESEKPLREFAEKIAPLSRSKDVSIIKERWGGDTTTPERRNF